MATKHSPVGASLTHLILKVFRLNGVLLDAADQITLGSGLTAARWQVLGAVQRQPLSVADVARAMGLTRQSVQRLADILVAEGFCEYRDNPAHRRAKLLAPAPEGMAALSHILPVQVDFVNRVGAAVGLPALEQTNATVDHLLEVLASPSGRVNPRPPRRGAGRRSGSGSERH